MFHILCKTRKMKQSYPYPPLIAILVFFLKVGLRDHPAKPPGIDASCQILRPHSTVATSLWSLLVDQRCTVPTVWDNHD